jgi:hypothetical protein
VENRLKIRGAVTVGNLISTGNMVIGKPIVEAYRCEQIQDWMGCWINSKCMRTISKEDAKSLIAKKQILRYKIPLKSGRVSNLYAFNWLKPIEWDIIDKNGGKWVPVEKVRQAVSYLGDEKGLEWDARRKMDNTKLFCEYALSFPEEGIAKG